METFQRICIEEYIQEDQKGNKLHLKRGNEYHTSREQDGMVMVFTNFWVYVPVTIFAGERRKQ